KTNPRFARKLQSPGRERSDSLDSAPPFTPPKLSPLLTLPNYRWFRLFPPGVLASSTARYFAALHCGLIDLHINLELNLTLRPRCRQEEANMGRTNLLAWLLSVCLLALTPSVGAAQVSKVQTEMSALQAATAKLGAPKVQGNDLYFGDTKASSDIVDAVVKSSGGVATLFVKAGD